MPKYIVKGERLNSEDAWEPFQAPYTAEPAQAARWEARRKHATGDPLAKLEETPPNSEREAVEIAADDHDRTKQRTKAEREEYDRLVQTVRITSVQEAKR